MRTFPAAWLRSASASILLRFSCSFMRMEYFTCGGAAARRCRDACSWGEGAEVPRGKGGRTGGGAKGRRGGGEVERQKGKSAYGQKAQ